MRQQPDSDTSSLDRYLRSAPDHHIDSRSASAESPNVDSMSSPSEVPASERALWRAPRRFVSALFDNDFFA